MWWSPRGRRWQYGRASHVGLVRLHARKHTPASVHPHPLSTHVHTHTHTEVCNNYCLVLWTQVSVTLYVHCLSCCVFICSEIQHFVAGQRCPTFRNNILLLYPSESTWEECHFLSERFHSIILRQRAITEQEIITIPLRRPQNATS